MDQQRSSVGHEVRTRLSIVKGYAQMVVRQLQRDDVPREAILSHAEELERQISGLESMTTTMFADDIAIDTAAPAGDDIP
jgi:uncharacterized protein YhjY with autotransporter beta-barrel domain